MSTNLLHLQLPPAGPHAELRESLTDAVLEVSARLETNNGERRRLHSRLDELRSADPSVRRSRPRPLPAVPPRPVTFFSIEEADPEAPARQVRRA